MKFAIRIFLFNIITIGAFPSNCVIDFNNYDLRQNQRFNVRGIVREKYSYEPIKNVEIRVNGALYLLTDFDGTFSIKVQKGDEITAVHKDFRTVEYLIKDQSRIIFEVEPEDLSSEKAFKRNHRPKLFNQLIDSADTYLKTDAERSMKFIADALDNSTSQKQNVEAYETLGDLNMHWKQYDLAITNYRIALQNIKNNATKLKLAKAYTANKNYSKSIDVFMDINISELSNYQEIEYYEGLGDAQSKAGNLIKAVDSYKKGLASAQNYNIKPKQTDLNSKIGQLYSQMGNQKVARGYFDNSLSLAQKESKKRSIQEKVTVAEFNSENKNFADEISLRKQVVDEVKSIEKDTIIANSSPITPQKQNYKIGNAYLLQKDYNAAIPFFNKSIEEAELREDLEVKTDALRKKADAYENLGEFDLAKKAFEDFMASVDEQYIKKEQEIAETVRLSRNLLENQNRITSLENQRLLNERNYELSVERYKNQQIIIYSLIGGLALLLIASFFTLKYIKQQRLANNLLALKSLRSQMNPHFIFNALNSVNSFIASSDERTANKYLSDFSFLMRTVLENSEQDFIPLKKEIELLELYTNLEHFRFKDKFDYQINIDQKIDVDDYEIPPMLLQPYIENAVWHGLRYKKEKGILDINISKTSTNEITINIIDNGIGRKRSKALKTENQRKHKSRGMSNIKRRIQILNDMYRDKIDVSISDFQSTEDVGTKVSVTLKKIKK